MNYAGQFFGLFFGFAIILWITLFLLDFFGGLKDFFKGRVPRLR